ncbi:hypothetical protein BDV12DRAFT_162789 [Aspergillus spectabilis]
MNRLGLQRMNIVQLYCVRLTGYGLREGTPSKLQAGRPESRIASGGAWYEAHLAWTILLHLRVLQDHLSSDHPLAILLLRWAPDLKCALAINLRRKLAIVESPRGTTSGNFGRGGVLCASLYMHIYARDQTKEHPALVSLRPFASEFFWTCSSATEVFKNPAM